MGNCISPLLSKGELVGGRYRVIEIYSRTTHSEVYYVLDTHLSGYTDLGDTEDHVHHLYLKVSTCRRRVSINSPCCLGKLKVIKAFDIKRHGIFKGGRHAALVFQTYHIHCLNQESLH